MTSHTARSGRVDATREAILLAAERLFAEHGVYAVSNRQISEAAKQGNNAAVGYHFGTKTELIRAIFRKRAGHIEQLRHELLNETGESTKVRDWVRCLVIPATQHLASAGSPTWYARFGAQVMSDPTLRRIIIDEALHTTANRRTADGLNRCVPDLPLPVYMERQNMGTHLLVHMCAERERALAEGKDPLRATWHDMGKGLIDAITAVWLAPITPTAPQ